MPNGINARKLIVYDRIAQLPSDQKTKAQAVYKVLDRIEWLTFSPLYFGMLFIALLMCLPYVGIEFKQSAAGATLGIFSVVIAYILGVAILKIFFFNSRRKVRLHELNGMIEGDPSLKEVIHTLREIDPDIFRNLRKLLPEFKY